MSLAGSPLTEYVTLGESLPVAAVEAGLTTFFFPFLFLGSWT